MSAMSRRALLRGLGAMGAAAIVRPRRASAAASSISPVMTTLSTYMSGAGARALPPDVVEKAKHHIVDTFAAMVSGTELPPGQVALRFAATHGEKTATVAGSRALCGPIEAAFVNALLAHADETDDSHAPSQSHPGCAAIPAAPMSLFRIVLPAAVAPGGMKSSWMPKFAFPIGLRSTLFARTLPVKFARPGRFGN